MASPVYSFGPHAHPDCPQALKEALSEAYPSVSFELGSAISLTGEERVVVECSSDSDRRISTTTYQTIVAFARGFVAGYSPVRPSQRAVPVAHRDHSRYSTLAETPSAKLRSSLPPPASYVPSITLPEMRPVQDIGKADRYPTGEGPIRFPTHQGIAPPSRR